MRFERRARRRKFQFRIVRFFLRESFRALQAIFRGVPGLQMRVSEREIGMRRDRPGFFDDAAGLAQFPLHAEQPSGERRGRNEIGREFHRFEARARAPAMDRVPRWRALAR